MSVAVDLRVGCLAAAPVPVSDQSDLERTDRVEVGERFSEITAPYPTGRVEVIYRDIEVDRFTVGFEDNQTRVAGHHALPRLRQNAALFCFVSAGPSDPPGGVNASPGRLRLLI
jgi:hypothetical protein